jgi:hypothetical protein
VLTVDKGVVMDSVAVVVCANITLHGVMLARYRTLRLEFLSCCSQHHQIDSAV